MKFPKIISTVGTETVLLEPITANKIYARSRFIYVVVYYRITYTNTSTGENIETIITYYLSNGYTNKFRANMLFPFYNFSKIETNSCPSCEQQGLLLKISLVTNIDTTDFNNNLQHQAYKKIISSFPVTNEEEYKMVKHRTNGILKNAVLRSENFRVDVLSVLPRIKNLLDYLIAVNSDMLHAVDLNNRNFRPVSGDEMYNPSIVNDTRHYPDGRLIYLEDDVLRGILIDSLRHQLKNLMSLELFRVEFIELSLTDISDIDFNDERALCVHRTISSVKLEEFDKYITVSQKIHSMFLNKLSYLKESPAHDEYKKFIEAYIKTLEITPSINTVERNLSGWGATCKQKYIKYKKKYLMLKNQINK
jgi:hypothetical protein